MKQPKIDYDIDQQLLELSNKLPKPKLTGRIIKTGAELLKENPEAKDRTGKPIDPKLEYTFSYPPAINHYRRLRKAYIDGGAEAVNKYLKPYIKEPENTSVAA